MGYITGSASVVLLTQEESRMIGSEQAIFHVKTPSKKRLEYRILEWEKTWIMDMYLPRI